MSLSSYQANGLGSKFHPDTLQLDSINGKIIQVKYKLKEIKPTAYRLLNSEIKLWIRMLEKYNN